ncbi:MAG: cytochrome c oxidase assembly protein [Nocardioidaceae bacterium]
MTEALRLIRGWEPAPVPWLVLAFTAAVYLVAAHNVTRSTPQHPWPWLRSACFGAGLAVTAFAVVGPPGAWDDIFFYAHMTQHILLTLLAAPLLVLGDPVLLALRASNRVIRKRWLVPCLRSRAVRVLTHPAAGWSLFVGVMAVTHLPKVYDGFLDHPVLHDYVEHPLYLVSGLVFFQPLLSSVNGGRFVPHGVRLVSLFSVMVPMAMIGFFIYAAPRPTYPFYVHVDRPFGPGPLADQHLAGVLMWSTSMGLSTAWLVVAANAWLRAEERTTRRSERTHKGLAKGTTT